MSQYNLFHAHSVGRFRTAFKLLTSRRFEIHLLNTHNTVDRVLGPDTPFSALKCVGTE
ncbi:hypothetical protein BDQ12DRAFT_691398 [Crucibulum laeve]|uniref:Uncharacterized protein n=1 Tax=Crucibulum laeve TaxID=68775 RepID=A0A5C3LM15_9AGAR|nr:hypothetical protein BDQ12DRAFT_691398 [Crucibulum laeve]